MTADAVGPAPLPGGGPDARPEAPAPATSPLSRAEVDRALLRESRGFADALRRRPARLPGGQARQQVRGLLEDLAAASGAPRVPDPPDEVPALAAAVVVLTRDLVDAPRSCPDDVARGLLVRLVRLRSDVTGESLPHRLLARAEAAA